jgi:Tol biopolymer transport system component
MADRSLGFPRDRSAACAGFWWHAAGGDGSRVAVQIDDGDNDIWVWDLARETLTRVTTDPGLDQSPLWTPDDQRLLFTRGGSIGALFWQAADGSGAAERLTQSSTIRRATSVYSDGSAVLYTEDADVMVLTLDKGRRVQPVVRTQQPEQHDVISPNGQWLAHAGFDGAVPRSSCARSPT